MFHASKKGSGDMSAQVFADQLIDFGKQGYGQEQVLSQVGLHGLVMTFAGVE